MKTLNLFKFILLGLLISACSDNNEPTGSGSGNEPVTAITLSTASNEVNIGSAVTFTVQSDVNTDVTSASSLELDGTTTSNPITFSQLGSFTVVAAYEDLTSNTLTITVVDIPASEPSDTSSFTASGAPTTYTKKALLEDFTGTWCPQCPPAGSAIANAMSGNSNIFGVGYHAGGGGSEPMTIPETAFWSGYYNVTGFPTVYVNGPDTRWNYNSMSQVNSELAETATVGLAVDAALVGGKLDLEVKVGFNTAANEAVQLMIYLLEDNVTTSTAQAGSSQGANYVHRDVLREVYTDQLGDVIEASNTMAGGVLTRTLTGLDLPSNIDDVANLKVIAFVRNTYTKTFVDYFDETHTDSPHYDIYNVQEVHVGETQAFD